MSALAGAVVGGVSTLLTTWLTHTAQVRATRLVAERVRREDLYGRFMDELAALYARALGDGLTYPAMVDAIALRGRLMLFATPDVVRSAERALGVILDLHGGQRLSAAEVRRLMENGTLNAIPDFAAACRAELLARGLM